MDRPALLGLALFALAWIQVSVAAHQFEHIAGEASDVCGVCLQLEQADEQLHGEPSETPSADRGSSPTTLLPAAHASGDRLQAFARGPPTP
ncbi:MAG: hypothetical protein KJO31_02895 [Gammaproteobacteria bacterium]|nr:hypothetical protein [Gammaproteobacteria bacterium]